jgi:hypothetical protein
VVVAWVLATVAGLAFLAGFGWLWWHSVPVLYDGYNGVSQGERLTAITSTRAALLAGLLGIGALGTLLINARTLRSTNKTLKISEANYQLAERSQRESSRLAERGHLTDRYSKGIEHLGSDKLDVRLGGIYALEQLARESPQDGDQCTIVEVLSAFIRVHSAPAYQYREYLAAGGAPVLQGSAQDSGGDVEEYAGRIRQAPVDVQAAITVLGRLSRRSEAEHADFSGAWLRMTTFHGDFSGSAFNNANMRTAFLTGATLVRASFDGTKMVQAVLNDADLRGAAFQMADLSNAILREADLRETDLGRVVPVPGGAHGEAVDMLIGPNLSGADLQGADLRGVDLTGTNLAGANVRGAKLDGATLSAEAVDEVIGLSAEQKAVIKVRPEVAKGTASEGLPAAFATVKEPWRIHRSTSGNDS